MLLTHQVGGQAEASQLSDAVLRWFGLLLSCCTGLDATMQTTHRHTMTLQTNVLPEATISKSF